MEVINMNKPKFTWEEFKKGWSKNGMVISDTKENMLKFIRLAKENGIELEDFNIECGLGSNIKELYFSSFDENLKRSNIIDDGDIPYTLQEVLNDLNMSPLIKTGDVVELRNGAICVMLYNAFLNLNDKIVEAKLEYYTEDYLDNNYGGKGFDVMKIKHMINPFDYFRLDKIEDWDWVREEKKEIKLEDLKVGTRFKFTLSTDRIFIGRIVNIDGKYRVLCENTNAVISLDFTNDDDIKILEIVEE